MIDYTPTTEEVSIGWAWYKSGWIHSDEIQPQFDRWLAEVKATERKRIIQLLKEEQSAHYALGNYYGEIAISAAINFIEGETK